VTGGFWTGNGVWGILFENFSKKMGGDCYFFTFRASIYLTHLMVGLTGPAWKGGRYTIWQVGRVADAQYGRCMVNMKSSFVDKREIEYFVMV